MIREARFVDIPRLVDLGVRFMREANYAALLPPDRTRQAKVMRQLIGDANGLILVSENENEIEGMLGAVIMQHPFSAQWVMQELFWYLRPDRRGAGIRLLKKAEDWARSSGATRIILVAPSKRIARFYRKTGLSHMEEHFIKSL